MFFVGVDVNQDLQDEANVEQAIKAGDAVLSFNLEIKRADTGKVEHYTMVGRLPKEHADRLFEGGGK